MAAGYMGIALRGWVPLFVSIPLANVCIMTGHAFFLRGINRLTGHQPLAWPVIAALGLTIMASLSYFTYAHNSTAARMAIQFSGLALLSLTTARHLWKTAEPGNRLPHRIVAAIFATYGLTLLFHFQIKTVIIEP